MLDSLRAFSRTWIAKVFFAVLIVSFGAFGISNVITGIGSTTVARVGTEDISVRDFQRLYNQQLDAVQQQYGIVPTAEQALAAGIPGTVLQQLAVDAALNQLALSYGVGVSKEHLAKMLLDNPAFGGTLGAFDKKNFDTALQQNGFTETEFYDIQTKDARREQLRQALLSDPVAPKAAVELVSRYQGDTRTIEYFVLSSLSLPTPADPTDAELQTYLTDHQADFRTQATRTVNMLVLTPETLAAAKTPTDAEIAAEYEKEKQSLGKPEKRTIRQAILPNQAAVDAFTNGKAAGKTFDQLVTETGVTVTELGTLGRADVTDQSLGAAAFALPLGDYSVIPGIGGKRAVNVTAIEGGGVPTLEEVKSDLVKQVQLAQARAGYLEIQDQVEELRAAFQPLADIAKRFGLTVAELKVSASGEELSAVPGIEQADRTKVATGIFGADPKAKLAPTLSLGSNRNIYYDVTATEDARDQTLDEVRDAVLARWTAEKTDAALAAEAAKITAELKAGKTIDEIATSYAQFPTLSPPLNRGGDGTSILNQAVASAIFGGGPGHFGAAKDGDGDYVIFQVTDIVPSTTENPQVLAAVQQGTRQTLYNDFVIGVRNDAGVRENGAVLNQLLNLGAGS